MEPQAPSGTFLKVRGQEAKRQFLLWQTPSLPGGFKLGRQDTTALYPSLSTTFGELGATVRRHCCSLGHWEWMRSLVKRHCHAMRPLIVADVTHVWADPFGSTLQ